MGTPEQLGPYRLVSALGSGGFGEVHLALDPAGRTVAVKVLHPHVASDGFAITRLVREVETMRRVRGAHVAEVLDASLSGDRPYIVTRYVQGRPLSAVVADGGPVAGADLLRLALGLAEALESVHAAEVVHRDLKPANVIVSEREPYVIDFGIACALESASVTASGAVVGTPGYLAPEVLEGREAGPEADVFAWGATLAYAASGRQPYGTGPAAAIAYRVVHREPDLSGVPSWLVPIVERCLSADPADRPATAELAGLLKEAAPVLDGIEPSRPALSEAPTQQWRPGDRRQSRPSRGTRRGEVDDPRAAHREKLHRRWVIGSAVVVGLFAAAARANLPEVSLLLLVLYGIALLVDAGFGLLGKSRRRLVVDLAGGVGAVAVWALLSSLFSTATLLMAVGTVLFLLVMLVFAS
ncbi:serine/threonine-protein kinase [Microbispora bryophytorum]|uniref:Serine/threonine protein kinase n=1 Tax=Microbispora bryophytorum subsp. camponoti TaxID=1677852 RepID=A0ABR8L9G4_9ACTN|nr:serine/threonine-protein kinase [Microbispora camponoti]MBD3146891.1 serine/threonine protein kinase [Microbispora camponoti]